jgi:hypothetical protein
MKALGVVVVLVVLALAGAGDSGADRQTIRERCARSVVLGFGGPKGPYPNNSLSAEASNKSNLYRVI